jgi:HD-GYP domain-containing protein (c-di-GMP phosphodiesterase class II)
MLAAVPGLERVAHITRHHHERFDGRGYPDGLAGEEIPLGSRIVAACDAYHALISPRPYRGPLRPHEALELLRATAGAQLDPAVVDALGEVADDPLAAPVRRFRRGGTL